MLAFMVSSRMKKNLLVYTFALFSIVFSSCGGDGDSAPKDATSEEATSEAVTKEETSAEDATNDDASSNCDAWLDDYEAYIDDYIRILKKYQANPTDMSVMQEYQSMMQKAQSMSQNTPDDCAADPGFMGRMSKITAKMSGAAAGI